MKTFITFISLFFIVHLFFSQVNITSSNYTQNFGTSAITTWTNNSTFLGWYVNDATEFKGEVNITATAPTNTGGVYAYRCSGGTDRKLGSRASGGTGTIHYGVRIKNTTGSTIKSVSVSYSAFQLSLAENNNNSNILAFSYKVVSSPSVIDNLTTTTGYTNVAALNYTAPTNHGGPGTSNQVNGIPCTTNSTINSCITVSIPHDGEIMLRWSDVDNAANDHHIAIDDVSIAFSIEQTNCTVLLPIELIGFDANCEDNNVSLNWSTATERNNDFFIIEASKDGLYFEEIQRVQANGNTSTTHYYSKTIENQNYAYIKLKQRDFDGITSELGIISLDCKDKNDIFLFPNPTKQIVNIQNLKTNSEIILMDATGKIILNERNLSDSFKLDMSSFKKGVYIIQILNQNEFFNSFITLID
jgi:hypothetical protein